MKIIGHKIYVYVFAIQSMLCTDYELFDMFYNEIQFFGCKSLSTASHFSCLIVICISSTRRLQILNIEISLKERKFMKYSIITNPRYVHMDRFLYKSMKFDNYHYTLSLCYFRSRFCLLFQSRPIEF